MTCSDMIHRGLPDPGRDAAFHEGVLPGRFIAWCIDMLITGLLTLLFIPFAALFSLPFLFFAINMIYRIAALARKSATPGMRLVSLEFRTYRGERFDPVTAGLHTLGYLISVAMVFPQVISIILMLTTSRAQGLTDMLLGTAAINLNRAARF